MPDIGQGVAGPYCAHILCQQGAEIIKVERSRLRLGPHVGVVRGQLSSTPPVLAPSLTCPSRRVFHWHPNQLSFIPCTRSIFRRLS
ncbi:CoA transferase [Cupriavidus yeoncheonensis]|uniref:CoA transferase n=1 Tax=Cupriavidus yeoncheonensis TaxID=1462994 RepID=UPI001E594589|nr:CoA transferase [Cupriavidus yeoncheonensis]